MIRQQNISAEEIGDYKLIADEACKLCMKESHGQVVVEIGLEGENIEILAGPLNNEIERGIDGEESWSLSIIQSLTNLMEYIKKEEKTFIRMVKQLPPLPYPRS